MSMIFFSVPFQVFFSSYIFSANVMVKVATRPADNPVSSCDMLWLTANCKRRNFFLYRIKHRICYVQQTIVSGIPIHVNG